MSTLQGKNFLSLGANSFFLGLTSFQKRVVVHSRVVQSIVSLTSLLMTNSLTVVAKVFSNTLNFFLQKTESLFFSSAKRINVFAIFQDRNFNVTLAYDFVKF